MSALPALRCPHQSVAVLTHSTRTEQTSMPIFIDTRPTLAPPHPRIRSTTRSPSPPSRRRHSGRRTCASSRTMTTLMARSPHTPPSLLHRQQIHLRRRRSCGTGATGGRTARATSGPALGAPDGAEPSQRRAALALRRRVRQLQDDQLPPLQRCESSIFGSLEVVRVLMGLGSSALGLLDRPKGVGEDRYEGQAKVSSSDEDALDV